MSQKPHHIYFLHGIGADVKQWKSIEPYLDRRLEYVHLLSESSAKPMTLSDMADRVEEQLHGVDQPLVIGFSFGGLVALELLRRKSISVSGIICISTPYDYRGMKSHHRWLLRFFQSPRVKPVFTYLLDHPRILANWLTIRIAYPRLFFKRKDTDLYDMKFTPASLKQWFASLFELMKQDYSMTLHNGRVPVLCLYGEKDQSFRAGYFASWRQFPHVSAIAIPDSDHNPVLKNPRMLGHAIQDFIKHV